MNRPLYHQTDPFAKNRAIDAKQYAVDLFYDRLLVAKDRMHTKTAKNIAIERTEILTTFLAQLKDEIEH